MPLLERVRVEAYLSDLPSSEYQNLLRSFEEATNFDSVARYVGELKRAALEPLSEEAVLISVEQVYHSV